MYARGLCRKHYRQLREKAPALFDEIAEPDPKARQYTFRRQPKEGRCRVAVGGRGCPRPAKVRGLCEFCYNVLRSKPELLKKIALPAREITARSFERRADLAAEPLQCVVIENSVPCSRPPEYRGVCRYHRKVIGTHSAGRGISQFLHKEVLCVHGAFDPAEPGPSRDNDEPSVAFRHFRLRRRSELLQDLRRSIPPARTAVSQRSKHALTDASARLGVGVGR